MDQKFPKEEENSPNILLMAFERNVFTKRTTKANNFQNLIIYSANSPFKKRINTRASIVLANKHFK